MDIKQPRIVSLFSGAGGLDIGFHKAGFKTVFATDIWDKACETLKNNGMSERIFCGDVRQIDFTSLSQEIGGVDCLIGGPPCPPYSQTRHYLIGKADGFQDEKAGFAVPEYFRALETLRPKVFFFENVDGFMFKTHTEAFSFLKDRSEELGYDITFKVINCANYGIPQTRKRFICVGVQKGLGKFEFPKETHLISYAIYTDTLKIKQKIRPISPRQHLYLAPNTVASNNLASLQKLKPHITSNKTENAWRKASRINR